MVAEDGHIGGATCVCAAGRYWSVQCDIGKKRKHVWIICSYAGGVVERCKCTDCLRCDICRRGGACVVLGGRLYQQMKLEKPMLELERRVYCVYDKASFAPESHAQ
jgi:hypothetical protein